MSKWDNFLKSLETEGGKLVVLIFMIMFVTGIGVLSALTGHPLQEVGREMLTGAIASLLGILYGYLRAGPGPPRPPEKPNA